MKRVAVVGAGTMGHGIAQVAALAGYATALTDAVPEQLPRAVERVRQNLAGGVRRGKLSETNARAALDRLATVERIEDAVRNADVVIEAVIEDIEIKRQLFEMLGRATRPTALLATNTSSLSVKEIAEASRVPERVIGMHFFNPVHIMKLVEIVRHDLVREEIVAGAESLATAMKKDPIVVSDSPGFASSRLGVVLGLEAMRMLEQGVASAQDIDKAMELGYGHPMGPLKVTDLVGLDVRLSIAQYLNAELKGSQYAPPRILEEKVARGELGKKTGKGFYEW